MGQCYISAVNLPAYNLQGKLPQELANLSQLEFLSLYINLLTGPIPSSLGNIFLLEYLYLSSNLLTGSIPSSVRHLKSLHYFYINSNSLQGSLEVLAPTSKDIDFLPLLIELDVADNAFSGSFPATLLSTPTLSTLAASSNCFSGNLSFNGRTGNLSLNGRSSIDSVLERFFWMG